MTEPLNENPKPESDRDDLEVDLLRRLMEQPKPTKPTLHRPEETPELNDDEAFWAVFSMITPAGERFTIDACFRNRQHYNAEMHKFETAKNIHVVLKDINGESVVIKRDILLHVLPNEHATETNRW